MLHKDGLYSFLKSWLDTNGTVSGDCLNYTIRDTTENNIYITTYVTYNATYDGIYLATGTYVDGYVTLLMLEIPKKITDSFEFDFGFANENDPVLKFKGKIVAKDFTTNSPIPCENYSGDEALRTNAINVARNSFHNVLIFGNEFLKNNIGLTIEDIGFTSFL